MMTTMTTHHSHCPSQSGGLTRPRLLLPFVVTRRRRKVAEEEEEEEEEPGPWAP
jgi:hypothetical protein